MGVVYRARDPKLGRDVAIKVLGERGDGARELVDTHDTVDLRRAPAPGDGDGDALAEARAMARLSHPNVLPIYEVGSEGRAPFLVMEYIAGPSLRAWLAEPRATREVASMFAQAARGLAAAHAVGVVHRDFKPDNVLVGPDGRARVADFGLANVVVAAGTHAMERVAEAAGTPRYMAPELLDGARADAASDVFALCRSAADALAGRADVPAALQAVVAAGLADDAAARPTLDAVIVALESAAAATPPAARRRRRRQLGVIAAVSAATAAVGWMTVARRDAGAACDDAASSLFAGRWDDTSRAALRARLPADQAQQVIARVDVRARSFVDAHAGACRDRAAGELAPADAERRLGCLDRRAIELGADVRRALAHPAWPASDVTDTMLQGGFPEACRTLVEAPPRDAETTAALVRRLVDSDDIPLADQLAPLTALERDALAAGEVGLAARSANAVSGLLRIAGRLADADAAADRAYRDANSIDSSQEALHALLARSDVAAARGDATNANSYAKLAEELADKPDVPVGTRARVYSQLAQGALDRGDDATALADAETGLAIEDATAGNGRDPRLRASLDAVRVIALVDLHRPDEVAAARDHLASAIATLGAADANTGVAHRLLAQALAATGQHAEAVVERRAAIAVIEAAVGADNSYALDARRQLAEDLEMTGQRAAGIAELERVLDAESRAGSGAIAELHASTLGNLGLMRFRAGDHDAGLAQAARAADELAAQLVGEDSEVRGARGALMELELQMGRVDDAARELAAIEASARRGAVSASEAAQIAVWTGELAIGRARWADAEAAARQALASPAAEPDAREEAGAVLADALIGARRWADARAAIDDVRTRSRTADDTVAWRAALDVRAAEIAAGTGDRAGARTLATAALATLTAEPAFPREAARAARLAR
jgi:tetratricopeptide (TPR) repeat protein